MRDFVIIMLFIKVLRFINLVLSFATWMLFMLDTSDIPTVLNYEHFYKFSILFFIVSFVAVVDFVISSKKIDNGFCLSGYYLIEVLILV